MKTLILCVVGLLAYPASAQISTGTIIVFHVAKDRFIIAADSRAVFKGKPEDIDCKIAAFDHQFIFATSGGAGYRPAKEGLDPAPAFDNVEEARRAIRSRRSKNDADDLKGVADAWAENVARDFRSVYIIHPEIVLEAATKERGTLANGLFARAIRGEIVLAFRSITFSQARPDFIAVESIPQDCAARICATGITEVFEEYTSSPPRSERAKREGILNPTTDETGRIRRLVQLSILYTHPAGEVGGPIDVLELWNNGRIRWVSRKSNCPENQD
ncbi:MAG: hypothetical protein WAN12_01540 [Candidatus Acidiferrum sp.]